MCTSGIMYEQEEEEVAEEVKDDVITLNGVKYKRIDE